MDRKIAWTILLIALSVFLMFFSVGFEVFIGFRTWGRLDKMMTLAAALLVAQCYVPQEWRIWTGCGFLIALICIIGLYDAEIDRSDVAETWRKLHPLGRIMIQLFDIVADTLWALVITVWFPPPPDEQEKSQQS